MEQTNKREGPEGEKRMKVNYNLRNQWHFEIDFNNDYEHHQLADLPAAFVLAPRLKFS